MIRTDDEIIKKYKEVQQITIKEKCSVSLVVNIDDNQIAVKKDIRGNKSDIYKILKEAQIKNIPRIYHIVEADNSFTVIEEFIEGLTLQEHLQSSDFVNEEKLFDILEQLCSVLKALHNLPSPIIHRDIKPSNIIISNHGVLNLIDFDAAREYKSENLKDTVCLGTIEYAAPEQFGFSQTDVRSDIYAVGMLISEYIKHYHEYRSSQRFCTSFQRIIDKCTMFDPKQRYQNIMELEVEIRNVKKKSKRIRPVWRLVIPVGTIFFSAIILVCILLTSNNNRNSVTNYSDNKITEDAMITVSPKIIQATQDNEDDTILANEETKRSIVNVADEFQLEPAESDHDRENNYLTTVDVINKEVVKEVIKDSPSKEDLNTGDIVQKNDNDTNIIIPLVEVTDVNTSEPTESDSKAAIVPTPEGTPSAAETSTPASAGGYIQPVFHAAQNRFYKSNPQDVYIKIDWNDATKITNIMAEWANTPGLSSSDYFIESDSIIIKKEMLEMLDIGVYRWSALFDTNYGNSITIDVFD